MSHKLLLRLVTSGMQKNKRTGIPYLVAGTLTVMIYYILISLAYCPYIYADKKEAFYGAQTIAIMLELSAQIVAIFAVFFIFYANQFGMKGRKKEMALYGVLGMSKKNITRMMVMETILQAVISIGAGILSGTFLNKLMLLVLYRIIHQEPITGMIFSGKGLSSTIILFAVIYIACLIYNVSTIRVGNPIELLHSDSTGEKEPKVKRLAFIVGMLTLLGGYTIALTTDSTFDAINSLFVSILLVIIATYCLFTAGSIFILKLLKKNKKFYYKTRNFISVSNLMFRMKHNAAGLASICVLSTGVIILMTCGSSLMMLGEKNIDTLYPNDIKIEATTTDSGVESDYMDIVRSAAEAAGVDGSNYIYRQYKSTIEKIEGNEFVPADENMMSSMSTCRDVYLLTLDDYNRYAGEDIELGKDEVLVYRTDHVSDPTTLKWYGTSYKVKGTADYDAIYYIINPTMSLFERMVVVFADEDAMNAVVDQSFYQVYMGLDTKKAVTNDQMKLFSEAVKAKADAFEVKYKIEQRVFFYNIYGGAFFVGIFLAVLFLMATVLIIYYKQMSEGYEDQKRFAILANVGLTEKEAKKTIQRQVMILFFLPVIAAIVHVAVASKIIRLFLQMVLLINNTTFVLSIAVVCVIFVAVYLLVYRVTSGQYYRIVYGERR